MTISDYIVDELVHYAKVNNVSQSTVIETALSLFLAHKLLLEHYDVELTKKTRGRPKNPL